MIAIAPPGENQKKRIKRMKSAGADDNKQCEGRTSTRSKNSGCLLIKTINQKIAKKLHIHKTQANAFTGNTHHLHL